MVLKNGHTTSKEVLQQQIWKLMEEVYDPEVPVLSVIDLGIVRDVEVNDQGECRISITPTYTGCPAMDAIAFNIRLKLLENNFKQVEVKQVLSPVWTTDWMSEAGKEKLKAFGIAPPNPSQQVCNVSLFSDESIQCPHCESYNTTRISEFGSTACKSLYRCENCLEPFDYFKCH